MNDVSPAESVAAAAPTTAPVPAAVSASAHARPRRRLWRALFLVTIAILATRAWIGDVYPVKEQSMWPVLAGGCDHVFVDKLAAKTGTPERFEVRVFEKDGRYLVKRVLAFAGESVQFVAGDLFVGPDTMHLERAHRKPATIEAMRIPIYPDPGVAGPTRFSVAGGTLTADGETLRLVPMPGMEAMPPGLRSFLPDGLRARLRAGVDGGFNVRDDHVLTGGLIVPGTHAVPDVRITVDNLVVPTKAAATIRHALARNRAADDRCVKVGDDGLVITATTAHVTTERARFPNVKAPLGVRLDTLDGLFRVDIDVHDGAGWRELFSEPRDTAGHDGYSAVTLAATGGPVEVCRLAVSRDVHYVWSRDAASGADPRTVDSGRLFFVGDNVPVSTDSRDDAVGDIRVADTIGRVRAIVWPPARWQFIR